MRAKIANEITEVFQQLSVKMLSNFINCLLISCN